MNRIRLLLADDHSVLRAGLKLLLNAQQDMEVVGEASDGEEAVAQAINLKPDIVLMDIAMPRGGGVEATRRIKQAIPEARVVALTMHDDGGYLREMMAAGASGYVLKRAADTELLSAIRAVHASGSLVFAGLSFNPMADLLAGRDKPGRRDRQGLALLSEREREVLRHLALGYTNQEIADLLFISVKTVETHKSRILEKLNLRRRSDLVRFAMEQGLVTLDA